MLIFWYAGQSEEDSEDEDYHDDVASESKATITTEPKSYNAKRGDELKLECKGDTGNMTNSYYNSSNVNWYPPIK